MKTFGVRQRTTTDCGICCVAMALDIPYEAAAKLVPMHDRGSYTYEIATTLGRELGSKRTGDPQHGDIVNTSRSKSRLGGHFVFMIDRHMAYDPNDGQYRNIDEYVVWDFVKMRVHADKG